MICETRNTQRHSIYLNFYMPNGLSFSGKRAWNCHRDSIEALLQLQNFKSASAWKIYVHKLQYFFRYDFKTSLFELSQFNVTFSIEPLRYFWHTVRKTDEKESYLRRGNRSDRNAERDRTTWPIFLRKTIDMRKPVFAHKCITKLHNLAS